MKALKEDFLGLALISTVVFMLTLGIQVGPENQEFVQFLNRVSFRTATLSLFVLIIFNLYKPAR